ncbi:MAG: CBS domain-containing protein [Thermodesulfobacteria bacterium]|nr:CBS domain-containing protein [Thermodesulfobacteriota bacterium]
MKVKDWMTENVIVLDEDDSVVKAMQVFKEHQIRRIPVVKDGKLVGIITDRDIKSTTPPKSFSMDMYETYYLISTLKLRDIMTPNPITVFPEDEIEKAAILMLEYKISGLPVVDEEKHVLGIITQTDIFKAFVSMSGAYFEGYKVMLSISSYSDLLKLIEILKKFNVPIGGLYNLICWKEEDCMEENCKREVILKLNVDEETYNQIKQELCENFEVYYFNLFKSL